MKKKLVSMFLIVSMLLVFAACSNGNDDVSTPPKDSEVVQNDLEDAQKDSEDAEKEEKPKYKDIMVPYDQLDPDKRIIMLQNTLNFSREGFYTEENKPVSESIEYNGSTVNAYSMSYPLNFLIKGMTDNITITNIDGESYTISSDDFAKYYIIIDFTSDLPPVLYNPEDNSEITDFLFAVTEEGEAIYSIVSGSINSSSEVVANVGWDVQGTYRFVAADKFHIPVGPENNETGEIRGGLSGAVNSSFPDLEIAGGKLNDLIFIEPMEQ